MLIDLNPIKEPEPLKIQLEEYVFSIPHRVLYEANKTVTADFEEDQDGYMEQIRIAYESIINSFPFQKENEKGELEKVSKPNVDLKLTLWQAEMLWAVVASFINDLFKKK